MAEQVESESIGIGQKVFYFAVIPLIFTTMLVGAGAVIIQQGHGKSFSGTLLQAGKVAASGTMNAVGSLTAKKAPPEAATGTADGGTGTIASPNGGGKDSAAGAASSGGTSGAGAAAGNSGSTSTAAAAGMPQSGTAGTAGAANAGALSAPPTASEEFKQKVSEVATEYSKMQPKQAGAIISAMSMKDAVYTVMGMKPQQRASILAVMDPKKAAEITRSLKDIPPDSPTNTDRIQTQLSSLPDQQQTPTSADELIKTYNQMPAHSSAVLITEMMKTDKKKALSIVSGMDTAARAQMMSDLVSAVKTNPDGVNAATAISQSLSN